MKKTRQFKGLVYVNVYNDETNVIEHLVNKLKKQHYFFINIRHVKLSNFHSAIYARNRDFKTDIVSRLTSDIKLILEKLEYGNNI